jgi:hypothetical protein
MTFSKALRKLTCVFSALLLAGSLLASDVSDFRDAVEACESRQALAEVLAKAPETILSDLSIGWDYDNPFRWERWTQVRDRLVLEIDARIVAEEKGQQGEVEDAGKTAERILQNPVYVDREDREGRNWLDNVTDRLGERFVTWIANMLEKLFGNRTLPFFGLGGGTLSGLTFVAWVLIIVVVGLVLFFILRGLKGVARKRRVGGILEDDEPERTADQWLQQAERLEAEGKFREAVRCLYLACLVRYDDGLVARFRRHETNWEHLYRIEASASNPKDIDFRDLTQRFDKVWYGYMVKGLEDVTVFKEVYKRLCQALKIKTAA